jgi:hypothetical protein
MDTGRNSVEPFDSSSYDNKLIAKKEGETTLISFDNCLRLDKLVEVESGLLKKIRGLPRGRVLIY